MHFRALRQRDIRLGSNLSDLIFAAAGHGYDERQRHFGFQQAQNEFIGGILPAFFLASALASDFTPLFAEFHSSAVYAYTQIAHGIHHPFFFTFQFDLVLFFQDFFL